MSILCNVRCELSLVLFPLPSAGAQPFGTRNSDFMFRTRTRCFAAQFTNYAVFCRSRSWRGRRIPLAPVAVRGGSITMASCWYARLKPESALLPPDGVCPHRHFWTFKPFTVNRPPPTDPKLNPFFFASSAQSLPTQQARSQPGSGSLARGSPHILLGTDGHARTSSGPDNHRILPARFRDHDAGLCTRRSRTFVALCPL